MSGELGDQPVGNRPHAFILFARLLRRGIHLSQGIVVRSRSRAGPGLLGGAVIRGGLRRHDRRLVFRPDIAPFDPQGPRAVNADKRAGASDLGRVEDDRTLLKGRERRLDLRQPLVDLLRDLVRFGVALLELVELGPEGVVGGRLLRGQRALLAGETAEIVGVAIGEVGCDLDPFPAFGANGLRVTVELFRDQPVQQARVLQPAAVIRIEEVAQDDPARELIGLNADELRPLVGRPHRPFRQHPADLVGLLGIGTLQGFPHLLLTRVVGIDGERHELIEAHAVLGIDFEQCRRYCGETQPLAHHRDRDEERRRDLLLGLALLAQRKERTELVERMQRRALDVLGEAVFLGEAVRSHHAGDRGGAGEPLLLDQEFERPKAAASGRNLEHAGLGALVVEDRPDGEALQQRAAGDVFRKLLDRDARLDAADIGLAQDQPVERDVARTRECDLRYGLRH